MSYHDRLEKSFILNRSGDILLEHAGWISDISPEGVVLLEGEELGTAALYHIASGACYPLPRELAGKRVYWHPCVEPQGGKCIGWCVRPSGRGVVNLEPRCSPEGLSISDSFAVDLQGNILFAPLPLYLNPYISEQAAIAEDWQHRAYRVNGMGETTFTYPAEWRYAGTWLAEGTDGQYEIRLRPKADKDNEGPGFLAGPNMEWLRGPFKYAWELREGMRCVRDVPLKPAHAPEEESPSYFVDAEWNRCLEPPKRHRFSSNRVHHGHIAFYPASNYCRQGLMDKTGNIIVKPRYSEMWHINGPLWWYKKKGGYGILHESGEELTPPTIGQAFWGCETPHGLVSAMRKGTASHRCGVINMQGEWVIEPRYGIVSSFLHPEYTIAHNWKKRG